MFKNDFHVTELMVYVKTEIYKCQHPFNDAGDDTRSCHFT